MFGRSRFGGFGGSGHISKGNKQKRSANRETVRSGNANKVLICCDELLQWQKNGTLGTELRKRNTNELKMICEENKIPRSGAKYEILQNIFAHVQ